MYEEPYMLTRKRQLINKWKIEIIYMLIFLAHNIYQNVLKFNDLRK